MRTSTYPLVDQILGGNLAKTLTDWREEGLTYRQMSDRLKAEHGVDISIETVRRWMSEGAA